MIFVCVPNILWKWVVWFKFNDPSPGIRTIDDIQLKTEKSNVITHTSSNIEITTWSTELKMPEYKFYMIRDGRGYNSLHSDLLANGVN